jgi:Tfp pilus assembly protein PilN
VTGILTSSRLGIAVADDAIRLALVSRQFSKVEISGTLSLVDWKTRPVAELKSEVAKFFSKQRLKDCRGTLVVSRQRTVLRQFRVPSDGQVNLAKVVDYQLANFLPSEDATAVYDFTAVKESTSEVQVTTFIVSRSPLEQDLQFLQELGITVDTVVPAGIAVANCTAVLGESFKPKAVLFIRFENGSYEAIGILDCRLGAWRGGPFSRDGSAFELLRAEVDFFRNRAGLGVDVPLDVLLGGDAGDASTVPSEALHVRNVGQFEHRTFHLDSKQGGLKPLDVQDYLLPLAAGLSGLKKKVPAPLNLLPAERRVRKESWQSYLLYGLVAANCLLVGVLFLRSRIQDARFSVELTKEIVRLEPEVRKVRASEDQLKQLHQRRDRLVLLKKQNSLVLESLLEMSLILPKHTVLTDMNFKDGSLEISGFSAEAAALPLIIDSSGYFKDVEFLSAITRSSVSADKETFRLRAKLERQPDGFLGPSTSVLATMAPSGGPQNVTPRQDKLK